MRALLSFVAGMVLGAALMWARPSPSAPSQVQAPPARPAPAPVQVPEQLPTDPAEVSALVERLAFENALLRGQIATLGGHRSEWPEDLPAQFREPALREWVAAATEGTDLRVAELECDEFPCVVALRFPRGADASSSVMGPVQDAYKAYGGAVWQNAVIGTDPPVGMIVLQPPVQLDPAVRERLDVRLKALSEAHGHDEP